MRSRFDLPGFAVVPLADWAFFSAGAVAPSVPWIAASDPSEAAEAVLMKSLRVDVAMPHCSFWTVWEIMKS
jgi:hypothetical protein